MKRYCFNDYRGLEQYAKDHQDLLDAKATLTIDEVLPLKEITVDWIESLASLKPFGTDNPEPVVSVEGIQVASIITRSG